MTHGGDKANSATVNRPDNVGNNWPGAGNASAPNLTGLNLPQAQVPNQTENIPDGGKTVTALANPGLPQTA